LVGWLVYLVAGKRLVVWLVGWLVGWLVHLVAGKTNLVAVSLFHFCLIIFISSMEFQEKHRYIWIKLSPEFDPYVTENSINSPEL